MFSRIVTFLLSGAVLLAVCAPAQPVVVSGFDHPESVWPTPGVVYVTNMGNEFNPSAKDGDGYVSTLDPRGRVLDRRFLTGLNAPKGMAVVGRVLYIADVDHLVGFSLTTKAKVFDLSFEPEKTVYLNDVVIKNAQTLYVSATDVGQVYEVNLVAQTYKALPGRSNGPNGLFYDAGQGRLFVVGYGQDNRPGEVGVFVEKQEQLTYQSLGAKSGTFDGIALLNGTTALISDRGASPGDGKIWRLDLTSNVLSPYATLTRLNGPADFGLFGQTLYIPQMLDGTVLIYKME